MPHVGTVNTTKHVVLSYIDKLTGCVNKNFMSEKNLKIIEAAMRVFARYGVKRTTMSDIASEADLVRQTLYLSYKSKDAVLCAVIDHVCEQIIAETKENWKTAETLAEKLDIFFENSVISIYRMISQSPDFEDLSSGFGKAGKEAAERANRQKSALLVTILAPHEKALDEVGETPATYAEFIQTTAVHIKHTARDETHLLRLINALKTSILSVCRQHGEKHA